MASTTVLPAAPAPGALSINPASVTCASAPSPPPSPPPPSLSVSPATSSSPASACATVPAPGPSPSATPGLPAELSDAAKKRIPAFVRKLRSMLDNDAVLQIHWTPAGDAFRVVDSVTFSRDVLPNYFKHNNWQSFIRQLNIYGFVKLTDAAHTGAGSGSSSSASSDWCFKHPLFLRHAPLAMEEIKRRTPKTPKPTEADAAKVASLVMKAAAQSVPAKSSPVPGSSKPNEPAASVAAANAARSAGVSPMDLQLAKLSTASMYSTVGAHSQQGPSHITSQNVRLNPSLALKSTAGTDSIASPISAPFASSYWPRTEHKVRKRLSSDSVSSTPSSTPPTAVESTTSEVDQLRSEMMMLQSQLGTLKRHMEEMGHVQARAMAHVMQVLSSTHDSPWGAVMELEDCVETWRCMSEKAAALFPSFVEDEDETSSLSPLSSADEWEGKLAAEPGVEPTMLLLNGASLLDSPALTSVDDGYDSFDDAATLEPDEQEDAAPGKVHARESACASDDHDPRPSKRRRRTK